MLARLFIAFFMLLVASEAFSAVPIAFSRCPATPEWTDGRNVTLSDDSVVYAERTFKVDVLDRFNEVNFPLSNDIGLTFITPCDLIYRDAAGVETVIEDCSSTFNAGSGVEGTATCTALDPHVSFDGTTIYYAVHHGTVYYRREKFDDRIYHPDAKQGIDEEGSEFGFGFKPIPNPSIWSQGAHIKKHVVGGATSTITPYTPGIWDVSPFLIPGPDGRIGFVSTRSGTSLTNVTSNVIQHTQASEPVMAIWSMSASGKDMELLSAHARTQEQHPIVLKDGRVAYSSWQTGMGIPFSKTQGTPGGSNTVINLFKIWTQFPDGSRNFPLIGQHTPQAAVTSAGKDFNALHFFAQRPNEDICFADYYRGGNNGLGVIPCYPLPGNFGEEGEDPHVVLNEADQYLPKFGYDVAPWATTHDDTSTVMYGFPNTPVTHPNYTSGLPYSGKVGWPFAIPAGDGELGLVWGKGACSVVGNSDTPFTAIGATPPQFSVNNNGYDLTINHITSLGEALQAYGNGYTSDIPGCNLGIYIATSIPVTNPDDLVMLVDTKGNHEFGARAVVPYTNIYGVSEPAVLDPIKSPDLPKGAPFGFVGAASITDREIEPAGGVPSLATVDLHAFNLQGTQTIEGITDDDFCGVRFVQMHHNDSANSFDEIFGTTGERVAIIGDLYTRNKDGLGDPIMETDGIHEDTSFLVEIPANVPYTMMAIDCEGRNLAVDQTWQHVKPGEIKTCGGCHVGHSPQNPPRNTFAASHAADPSYTPFQLGRGTVPLLAGTDGNGDPVYNNISGYGVVVNYDQHIKPILLSRCASCHSINGDSTSGREKGLVLDHNPVDPADYIDSTIQSTYWRLVYDRNQAALDEKEEPPTDNRPWQIYKHSYDGDTRLNRPFISKYIVAFNSRRSLLYWKAKGERTDNNTDGEYSGDLDYGAAHPATGITDEELRWIARWIDTGAQAGPGATDDKMPPTIHVDVTKNVSDEITHIIIGTVDLGSGIDPNSLNVCLMSGASCGANLAGPASMNGITSITLGTPISDPNQVIRATVSDVATNSRTVEFTAGYLMGLGDTSPPPDPDPVSISVGGNETITEGDTFSRTITFTDGEDAGSDGWTVDIDWCGTPENGVSVAAGQSSFGISRLFNTAGSCAVTVTITDDVGDTDNDTFTITIDPAGGGGDPDPLSIDAGGRAFVYEGNTFQRVVTLTDGEDTNGDGWTYSVDWGGVETTNGTIPAGSSSFTISRFMADGNKTSRMDVAVTVVDVAGVDESTDTFTLITRDVPRKGTITGAATA
ncbi:hypothetical protein, partial [Nitrosomonas marina]